MITSMHDRYYEPEDGIDASDWEECQESIAKELTQSGNWCDWRDPDMFGEAMSECGYDEPWWIEDVPPEALVKIKEYCWSVAMHRANDIMEEGGY